MGIMVGAGVIGIPYAVFQFGIVLGLVQFAVLMVLCLISIDLLLEAARLTGSYGLTDLGLHCIGKPSVYYINGLIFFKKCGFPIVYLITIADVWPKII